MISTIQWRYGWESIKPSHPKKPHYLLEAEDALERAYEDHLALCEQLERMANPPGPGFYASLGEAEDKCKQLEKYRLRLSRYFHETGDWELPIPYDRKSEKRLAELRMGVRF